MNINKINDILGADLSKLLTSGKKNSISEEELTQNIHNITDKTTKSSVIDLYINTLEKYNDPISEHFKIASSLLNSLSQKIKMHGNSDIRIKLNKILSTFYKNIPFNEEFITCKLSIEMADLERNTPYGLYPHASFPFSTIDSQFQDNLSAIFSRIRDEYKMNLDYCTYYIRAKQSEKPDNTYPSNRIGTLNASTIKFNDSIHFILSGCPQIETLEEHFHKAMIEADCTLWFTLNNIGENKICPKFWSNTYLKNLKLPDNWTIENYSEIEYSNIQPKLIESTLIAANFKESKTITHIHYDCWEDMQEAPSDALLLDCAKKVLNHIQKGHKVGINCKGGVGRTGTLAVLTTCMLSVQKQLETGISLDKISINVAETTFQLRKHRPSIIAATAQFLQVHRVLGLYYKELSLNNVVVL